MKLAIIIIIALALVALLVYLNRKPTTNKEPVDPQSVTGERMTLREAIKRTWKVLENPQSDDIVQIDKMCQIFIDREGEKPRYKVLYSDLDTLPDMPDYVKENTDGGRTTLFYDYPDGKAKLAAQFQEITKCPLDGIVGYFVWNDKLREAMDDQFTELCGGVKYEPKELPSPIPFESMTLGEALNRGWEDLQMDNSVCFELDTDATGCQITYDDSNDELRYQVVFSFLDKLQRPNVPDYIKEKYEGDLVYLYYKLSERDLLVTQLQEVLGLTLADKVGYYHWVNE